MLARLLTTQSADLYSCTSVIVDVAWHALVWMTAAEGLASYHLCSRCKASGRFRRLIVNE